MAPSGRILLRSSQQSSSDLSDPDSLELESLAPNDEEADPDAPLAMSSSSSPSLAEQMRPKWLTHAHRQRPWYIRWLSRISVSTIHLLRPRLTVRYVLFCLFVLYVVYCSIRRSPLLASRLPGYTGPHGVGAVEIEVPLPGGPKRVSDAVFKDSEEPAFEVESVLVTVFYPTDPAFRSSKPRYTWIPKPISLTAQGYAKLAHVDNFIMRPIFTFFLWAVGGSITFPAEVDAPLLDSDSDKASSLPVMVFSHGMASSRTDYTNFLGELASRGQVVAALDHRDGSCPGSLVKLTPKDPGRRRLPIRESDLKDKMDTPAFKRAQLAFRDAEILGAMDLLKAINSGKQVENTRAPLATLDDWEGRLNLEQLSIGGHSYGATGALQALTTVAPNATSGLILDPGKSSGPLNNKTTVPLLIVHSNSWSRERSIFYGRPHFDTVRDLAISNPSPSWFLTSLGTSHPSVTDAPLLEPLLLSWTTGANLDVKGALKEYVLAADEFFDFVETGKPKGLLAEEVTHEEYGKWVSEERRKEFPKDMAKRWEIHVAPEL